jgi:glycosyltransferase involved in cell wall biosynthesis
MIQLPSVSIIIPTLNSGKILEKCLKSISSQNYPKNKIEIIIADGGSNDTTLSLAKKYQAKIFSNPLKTGEAGKAVGVRKAKNEIIALIDSDNILPSRNWLKKMVKPFIDPEIIISEPIRFTYRRHDPYLTRYFALLGMNDPLCLFLGNYDRYSYLTGKWTNLKFEKEEKSSYIKIKLDNLPLPTIGANGTLIRKNIILKNFNGDYLFDIDIVVKLVKNKGYIFIAKTNNGIIHTFVEDSFTKFVKKQLRRINDLTFFSSQKLRETNWENTFLKKIIYFQIQCILLFPLIFQSIKGYIKKPDWVWLLHPIICEITLIIYLYGWLRGKISPKPQNRQEWKQ